MNSEPKQGSLSFIMNRATVRSYLDKDVSDDTLVTLAKAAQQAPFTGQMYAFIYTRDKEKKEILAKHLGGFVKNAPVFVLCCLDFRKLEKFIAFKQRENKARDIQMLFLGIQDVLCGHELGVKQPKPSAWARFWRSPMIVPLLTEMSNFRTECIPLWDDRATLPIKPSPRPRIPTPCVLFKERYHDLSDAEVAAAMDVMDAGLIREGYYQNLSKIPAGRGRRPGRPRPIWVERACFRKYASRGGGEASRSIWPTKVYVSSVKQARISG